MKNIFLILLLLTMLWACNSASNPKAEELPQKVVITKEDSLKIAEDIKKFTPDNHIDVMESILGKPKYDIKTIGILVYDGVNDLDFTGPRYVLGQAMGAKTQLIAIKSGNIKTVMGVEIVPNTVIDSVSQLDILIITGGFKGTIEAVYDEKLHEWIRKIDKTKIYRGSLYGCLGIRSNRFVRG